MFNNETIILIFNFTILFADSQNAPDLEISNNPAEDDDYDLQTGRFSEGKFTYVHFVFIYMTIAYFVRNCQAGWI